MCNPEICFNVNAQSIEESNLFLRKLYELLSGYGNLGWLFDSYREKGSTRIHIGTINAGEVSIDYEEKGALKNIYFSTTPDNFMFINECLKKAKQTYRSSLEKYTVQVGFVNHSSPSCADKASADKALKVEKVAYNNILCDYNESAKTIDLTFSVDAFGDFDLQYIVTQKVNYLRLLLSLYSNSIFKTFAIKCAKGEFKCLDIVVSDYKKDWIDTSDTYSSYSTIRFAPEFFQLFSRVLSDSHYDRTIRLILNSAQQLYCAQLMKRDAFIDPCHFIPGYIDLINTTLVSALEPISNINAPKAEVCSECGQPKYSIRKKVKELCEKYVPNLSKYIVDTLYAERSAYLHEGNAKTNEFYCGHCVPLLDPNDGKSFLIPVSTINFNMFEYVSFIIRKVIEENL